MKVTHMTWQGEPGAEPVCIEHGGQHFVVYVTKEGQLALEILCDFTLQSGNVNRIIVGECHA